MPGKITSSHYIHARLALTCLLLFLTVPVYATTAEILPEYICANTSEKAIDIHNQGYVQIGGIKQWVTIRGSNCANPVLLFVHGGPGNPLSLYSDSLYKGWEKEFTLVHWDQRGSGKTYEANQEPGELTMEKFQKTELTTDLIVSDGVEVANYVRKVLNKNKLIITGTSWGSVVAVKMITRQPEAFHFYVGLSQLVNYHKNTLQSYELALTRSVKLNDEKSNALLKAMGPPPWTNVRSFGQLRKIIRDYEGRATDPQPELTIAEEYATDSARAAYYAGEEFSFVKFVGFKGDGMAQAIALDKEHTEFQIPVYFIQGKEDMLTASEITKSYYRLIKAPRKKLVTIKRAGHEPTEAMLKKQFELIKTQYAKIERSNAEN